MSEPSARGFHAAVLISKKNRHSVRWLRDSNCLDLRIPRPGPDSRFHIQCRLVKKYRSLESKYLHTQFNPFRVGNAPFI